MMNAIRIPVHILLIMLATSCGKAFLNEEEAGKGPYNLVISGTVSDNSTLTPIEDIRIIFRSASESEIMPPPSTELAVYTDSKGVYRIYLSGLRGALSCTVTAEDTYRIYESQTCRLAVDWSGPSLINNTFYVNDLNMTLNKAE